MIHPVALATLMKDCLFFSWMNEWYFTIQSMDWSSLYTARRVYWSALWEGDCLFNTASPLFRPPTAVSLFTLSLTCTHAHARGLGKDTQLIRSNPITLANKCKLYQSYCRQVCVCVCVCLLSPLDTESPCKSFPPVSYISPVTESETRVNTTPVSLTTDGSTSWPRLKAAASHMFKRHWQYEHVVVFVVVGTMCTCHQ